MEKKASEEKDHIIEGIKELVITRIEAQMSSNMKLSVGGTGSLDVTKMIEHVKNNDEVGKQIIDSHMNFIKAQASGELMSALTSV